MSNQNVNYGSATTVFTRPGVAQITTEQPVYKENYYPFSMIGPIHKGEKEMDLLDRLFSVSKGAFRIFINLKNQCSDEHNLTTLNHLSDLDENQKRAFRRCVAELRKKDLVVRAKNRDPIFKVPKNTYMINPHYLKCGEYTKAKELWALFIR